MVQVIIDRTQWNAEFARLREFEPAAARALRRNMQAVGKDSLAAIKRTVLMPPPGDNPELTRESREAIAKQTKFIVNFTKRSAGVRFTTTPGKLGNFIFGYNSKQFRPTGRHKTPITQQGGPYFGTVLTKDNVTKLTARMEQVIDEANKSIGARL